MSPELSLEFGDGDRDKMRLQIQAFFQLVKKGTFLQISEPSCETTEKLLLLALFALCRLADFVASVYV